MAHVIDSRGVDLGDITNPDLLTYYRREPGYTVGGVTTPANPARSSADVLPVWAANTIYAAGQEILDPTGVTILVRQSTGTSRSTYDSTEQALWSAAGAGGGGGSGGGADTVTTVAASGATQTLTLGATATGTWDVTLTANCALTFAGATAGKSNLITLVARQDATGSRTLTFPATVRWPNGAGPSVTAAASSVDVYTFMSVDGGTSWQGFVGGQKFVVPAAPDTTAPTAPSSLAASNVTSTTCTLTWTASTDNVGVSAYDVYVGGSVWMSVSGTVQTASVTGLSASTNYSITVKARDAAGNASVASNTASVTTTATASIADTFNRADSTTTLGTTDTGSAAWSALSGTWGIISNQAYLVSSASPGLAVVDAGSANKTISFTISDAAMPGTHIAFRVSDTLNFWRLQFTRTAAGSYTMYLTKRVANVDTNATSQAVTGVADGSTYGVICSGNTLQMTLNGANVGSLVTDAFNNTATKFGMFNPSAANARWDNLAIS